MKDLSIIIISWNVRDLLKKCLDSIYQNQAGLELEVFVVDNASKDNGMEMVKKYFPQVKLIANSDNKGFSVANNQAVKQATRDYILFLNPDTEIMDDGLKKSIDFMKNNPKCGLMSCQMLNSDRSLQPSVRRFPGFWPILLMLLKIPKIFPNLKSINNYLATDFDYSREQLADQVMGAYMLVKREVIEKIGMLDERFFIWFDDTDYCKSVWKNGFEVWYVPSIQIIHHCGQSFAQQKIIKKQWHFFKSALKYFLKHGLINTKR